MFSTKLKSLMQEKLDAGEQIMLSSTEEDIRALSIAENAGM